LGGPSLTRDILDWLPANLGKLCRCHSNGTGLTLDWTFIFSLLGEPLVPMLNVWTGWAPKVGSTRSYYSAPVFGWF